MTDSTREMLTKNMLGVRETIESFARQIESGEYGETWTVSDEDGNVIADDATGSDDADVLDGFGNHTDEWSAERDQADEPTADDTPISEYPLEIVDERGREFAVVLCTGGPHIEVVADGGSSARLAGCWGGEQVYMHGDVFDTFLDYFIERD